MSVMFWWSFAGVFVLLEIVYLCYWLYLFTEIDFASEELRRLTLPTGDESQMASDVREYREYVRQKRKILEDRQALHCAALPIVKRKCLRFLIGGVCCVVCAFGVSLL